MPLSKQSTPTSDREEEDKDDRSSSSRNQQTSPLRPDPDPFHPGQYLSPVWESYSGGGEGDRIGDSSDRSPIIVPLISPALGVDEGGDEQDHPEAYYEYGGGVDDQRSYDSGVAEPWITIIDNNNSNGPPPNSNRPSNSSSLQQHHHHPHNQHRNQHHDHHHQHRRRPSGSGGGGGGDDDNDDEDASASSSGVSSITTNLSRRPTPTSSSGIHHPHHPHSSAIMSMHPNESVASYARRVLRTPRGILVAAALFGAASVLWNGRHRASESREWASRSHFARQRTSGTGAGGIGGVKTTTIVYGNDGRPQQQQQQLLTYDVDAIYGEANDSSNVADDEDFKGQRQQQQPLTLASIDELVNSPPVPLNGTETIESLRAAAAEQEEQQRLRMQRQPGGGDVTAAAVAAARRGPGDPPVAAAAAAAATTTAEIDADGVPSYPVVKDDDSRIPSSSGVTTSTSTGRIAADALVCRKSVVNFVINATDVKDECEGLRKAFDKTCSNDNGSGDDDDQQREEEGHEQEEEEDDDEYEDGDGGGGVGDGADDKPAANHDGGKGGGADGDERDGEMVRPQQQQHQQQRDPNAPAVPGTTRQRSRRRRRRTRAENQPRKLRKKKTWRDVTKRHRTNIRLFWYKHYHFIQRMAWRLSSSFASTVSGDLIPHGGSFFFAEDAVQQEYAYAAACAGESYSLELEDLRWERLKNQWDADLRRRRRLEQQRERKMKQGHTSARKLEETVRTTTTTTTEGNAAGGAVAAEAAAAAAAEVGAGSSVDGDGAAAVAVTQNKTKASGTTTIKNALDLPLLSGHVSDKVFGETLLITQGDKILEKFHNETQQNHKQQTAGGAEKEAAVQDAKKSSQTIADTHAAVSALLNDPDSVEARTCCASILNVYHENCSTDEEEELSDSRLFFVVFVMAMCGIVKSLIRHFRVLWLPEAAGCILVGVFSGYALMYFPHHDIAFDGNWFLRILVPPIIFEAALSIDKRSFSRHLVPIAIYAVMGTIFATVLTAFVVHRGTGMLRGLCAPIPFVEALTFGALISSIDPIAVLSVLSNMGMTDTDTIYVLIFGESLLNDGVAIVLFNTLVHFLDENLLIDSEAILAASVHFFVVAFGSLLIGVASGMLSTVYYWLFHGCQTPLVEVLMFICWALLPYYVCDGIGWSGIVSAVATGFVMDLYIIGQSTPKHGDDGKARDHTSGYDSDQTPMVDESESSAWSGIVNGGGDASSKHPRSEASNGTSFRHREHRARRLIFAPSGHLSDEARQHVGFVTEIISTTMETAIFAYLGLFLFSQRYHWNIFHCIIAILACIISRGIMIPTLSFLANWIIRLQQHRANCRAAIHHAKVREHHGGPPGVVIDKKMQIVLWFAGLRGAMSFALVEHIPLYDSVSGEGTRLKPELKAMTSASIMFTVFILGGYTYYLMEYLGIAPGSRSVSTGSLPDVEMTSLLPSKSDTSEGGLNDNSETIAAEEIMDKLKAPESIGRNAIRRLRFTREAS